MFRRKRGEKPLLTARFQEAITYASRIHAAQVRKGTRVPYLSHILGVASLVLEAGGDEDQAIAALLHDAVEDQPRGGKTAKEIERKFGDHVLEMVLACTDAMTHPKRPWIERKREYIARARTHAPDARLVSLADKLHNTRAILADYRRVGDKVWERFSASRDEALWYYRSLVQVYTETGEDEGLLRAMDRVVGQLESSGGAGR
jgi:(p)ppGpp synthase/HD superfamily hydrolase